MDKLPEGKSTKPSNNPLKSMSARDRHRLFSKQPDKSLGKHSRDETEPAQTEPARKKFRSEEKYLRGLLESKARLEQDQEKLDAQLNGKIEFHDKNAKEVHYEFDSILHKFKKEAYQVINMNKNEIPNSLIQSSKSACLNYKEFEKRDLSTVITSEDWKNHLDDRIRLIKQLQNSAVPIVEFVLAEAELAREKKDEQTDTMFRQFIERVKKFEGSEQKEQRLQIYRKSLQEYKQKYEIKELLRKMQKAKENEETVHVSEFLRKFKAYQDQIRAVGSLIVGDCLLPDSEKQSKLDPLQKAYGIASKEYYRFTRDHPTGYVRRSLEMLSTSIDAFQCIYDCYLNLGKSVEKGEGRAPTGSPVRDIVMKGSLSSDQEEKDRRLVQEEREYKYVSDSNAEEVDLRIKEEQDQSDSEDRDKNIHGDYLNLGKSAEKGEGRAPTGSPVRDIVRKDSPYSDQEEKDRRLAEELQEREYRHTFHSGAENIEEEKHLSGSEDSDMQYQSESESDKYMIKRDYLKLTKEQKRLYTRYKKIEIMQMKLRTYLRDSDLSHQEIGEVYKVLVDCSQEDPGYLISIHEGLCSELGGKKIGLEAKKTFYQKYAFNDEKEFKEGEVKIVFKSIVNHQEYLLDRLQKILKLRIIKDESKCKDFERFVRQMKLEQEREEHFQQRDIKVLKAEIRAKELAHDIIKEMDHGFEAMNYSTVAVAYMKNKENKTKIRISVNEGSSNLLTFMGKKLNKNEKLIDTRETKEDKRHAEQVLLDHARKYNLTIEGLGVSRNCCPNCWEAILESKEIIKPEAVSQVQPSRERLEQGLEQALRKKQDQRDTLHSDDVDDPYDITLELTSQEQPDQKKQDQRDASHHDEVKDVVASASGDQQPKKKHFPKWITESDKDRIKEAAQKLIRDFLGGDDYEYREINVDSILHKLKVFNVKGSSIDGLLMINKDYELERILKRNGIKDVTNRDVYNIWNANTNRKDVLYPAIPEEQDTISACLKPLYVFQRKGTKNVFVYDNLQDLARELDLGTGLAENLMIKYAKRHGWKLIYHIERKRDFPEWITESGKYRIKEAAEKAIRGLLGDDEDIKINNIGEILHKLKVFKLENSKIGELLMTNNPSGLVRYFVNNKINNIKRADIQNSWQDEKIRKSMLKPTIPEEQDTISACLEPLYVFQQKGTKNVFVYDNLQGLVRELGLSTGRKGSDTIKHVEDQNGWKLIYKKIYRNDEKKS